MRRLVCKCLAQLTLEDAKGIREPVHVGVVIPGGGEDIVHLAFQWLTRRENDSRRILLKLDLKNAFSSQDGQAVLEVVGELVPALAP